MRTNTILFLAATALAKTIDVDVGESGLTFNPDVITAAQGDTLAFHFYPPSHSVVLGTKDKPCHPATSGLFYSGFVPTSNGEAATKFMVMVNSTDTMYIYCSQDSHCAGGMSAVINGNMTGLDAYRAAAVNAGASVSPKEVTGGVLVSGSSSGTPTSSGGGSSATTSAAGSSSSTAKPAAAAGYKASVAGVLAAAGGVAALIL